MTRNSLLAVAACLALGACDSETRNGQLKLAGSTPVRIADESGRLVDFVTGPLKVEIDPGSDRKVTVTLTQGDRKAKFSGRTSKEDWNFTLRGREIGQPVDIDSQRSIELTGKPWTQLGNGGPCFGRGRWVTEDTVQKGNEDWKVTFSEAREGAALGTFASRVEGETYIISSRNLYCDQRDFPDRPGRPEPRTVKTPAAIEKLTAQVEQGVRFD